MDDRAVTGPLTGFRLLELGHFVAAPFATRLLADFGAEVIKVEPPGGDPVRQWGEQLGGHSLWWSVHARHKRSIAIDLKHKHAAALVLRLAARCDAVVENFRPGQLDKLGLSEAALRGARPDIVIARVSGYGQDGPYRDRAAFGVIGEAIGGLRYLTNHPPGTTDLPPVRTGLSIGDSVAGIYAALGVVAALLQRERHGTVPGAIDVALSEAVLSLTESVLPEYGALGRIRQPQGAGIATAAPTSAYPTADGAWMLIAANSDPLFARLAALMGQPDLPADPRFAGNRARVRNVAALDAIIAAWTAPQDAAALEARLTEADIPSTRVYTAADCAADPQFRERGMVREVADPLLGPVLHPGFVPRFGDDPGAVRWTGPPVGADTDAVLQDLLGMAPAERDALRADGVIR